MHIIKLQTELLEAAEASPGLTFFQLPHSHLYRLAYIPPEFACNIEMKKILWKMCRCRRQGIFFFLLKEQPARMYLGTMLANRGIPHLFVSMYYDSGGALIPNEYSAN